MKSETLLFFPGHMCDERLFAPQIEFFKPHYRIVVADLTKDSTFEMMIARAMKEVGEGPANVIGLSMGGMLAIQMVALFPERVSRLALIATTAEPEQPHRAAVRHERIKRARAQGIELVARQELAPSYLPESGSGHNKLCDLVVDMATKQAVNVFETQSNAMEMREDCRNALKNFSKPTLILSGDQDRLFSQQKHRDIASLMPRSKLVFLAGVGHLPTLEVPKVMNIHLNDWLNS